VDLLRRWKKDAEQAARVALEGQSAPSTSDDGAKYSYSCFLSYSTVNSDFAQKLYERLRQAGVEVWFAPENIHAGQKLHEQIYEAIRANAKLLLVLSKDSMNSEWVRTEIRNARASEVRDGKQKLFPIRLADMQTIRKWECFDADIGKDSAVEIREYFILDFSNWEDDVSFQKSFARLRRDLKSTE
jgi:hypothetical protein